MAVSQLDAPATVLQGNGSKLVRSFGERNSSFAVPEFVIWTGWHPSPYSNEATGAYPKAGDVHEKSASWEAANFSPRLPQLPIVHTTMSHALRSVVYNSTKTIHGRNFTKNRLILFFKIFFIFKQKAERHYCFIYLQFSLLLLLVCRLCGHIMLLRPRHALVAEQKNVLMRASM